GKPRHIAVVADEVLDEGLEEVLGGGAEPGLRVERQGALAEQLATATAHLPSRLPEELGVGAADAAVDRGVGEAREALDHLGRPHAPGVHGADEAAGAAGGDAAYLDAGAGERREHAGVTGRPRRAAAEGEDDLAAALR